MYIHIGFPILYTKRKHSKQIICSKTDKASIHPPRHSRASRKTFTFILSWKRG